MASVIYTYSSNGKRLPLQRGSFAPANLGTEIDGVVYQHPRVRADRGVASGSRVTITNPVSSGPAQFQRSRSIGMKNAGSEGRYRDLT